MASSGSFNTSKYSGGYGTCGLNVSWSITSQSIANNTSTIKWTVKTNGTMSSGYWYYCYGIEVKINGTTVLSKSSKFELNGSGGYKKTGTITIAHGSDGSKTVAMSARAKIYQNSWNCTGSDSFTLNKINRYALLGDVPNFTDEESPIVPFINPAGIDMVTDLKVRLMWNSDNDATSYVDVPMADWGGGSIAIDLDSYRSALRNASPSSNTLAVKYDLMSTMGGNQYHDYKSAVMNIVNADPTSGAVTYQDTDATVVGITGDDQVIVQLHSTLQIHTASSTGNKGASISSYKLTINGNDYTPDGSGNVTFVKPDVAGTYTAVVTTTDSRGNTSTASVNIPISGWAQPTALYSFERVANFVTNNATLHVDGAISSVTGSTMKIQETHREKDVGSWSAPADVPDDTDVTISNLDYQKEYELKIIVSDSFTRADSPQTNTEYLVSIAKGIPIFYCDTYRNSVAVNGIPDDDEQLYVGGKIHAKPNTTDAGVVYPIVKDTTEQIVGYWIDGSPIYEKVIELGSTMTLNSMSWTVIDSWVGNNVIVHVDCFANSAGTNWNCVNSHILNGNLELQNTRSSAITIDYIVIRYF